MKKVLEIGGDTSAAALPRQARVARISAADLPFCCPPPDAPQWNLHPRVFLPLSAARPEASCPYCGTLYILDDTAEKGDAGAGGRRAAGKKRRGAAAR